MTDEGQDPGRECASRAGCSRVTMEGAGRVKFRGRRGPCTRIVSWG
jgi:hypothetical protein